MGAGRTADLAGAVAVLVRDWSAATSRAKREILSMSLGRYRQQCALLLTGRYTNQRRLIRSGWHDSRNLFGSVATDLGILMKTKVSRKWKIDVALCLFGFAATLQGFAALLKVFLS